MKMNVSLGSPCVYVDMQLEIKPGTKKKKKMNGIKQYLRELESQRRCRSMLRRSPKTFSMKITMITYNKRYNKPELNDKGRH